MRTHIERLDSESIDLHGVKDVQALTEQLIRRLKITVEQYPDLKASHLVAQYATELSRQQGNITSAIQIFNANVENFNNGITMFPAKIVNRLWNQESPLDRFRDVTAEANLPTHTQYARSESTRTTS